MMRFQPLGDSAVTAVLSEDDAAVRVSAMAEVICRQSPPGFVDVVPAFGSITVYYDPIRCEDPRETSAYDIAAGWIQAADAQVPAQLSSVQRDRVEIPVFYGGEHGPDLKSIAEAANLSIAQFIELHSSIYYQVLAIGFMPGFAYLGGLPEKLKTPRLKTPRTLVPAGSVGIGGEYTGVYPFASPGGWNLIGRTSLQLFNPAAESPGLLHAGQLVRFRPVTSVEVG